MKAHKSLDLRKAPIESGRTISLTIGDLVIKEVIKGSMELESLDPESIMDALNKAVGKLAFYGSLRADAKKILARQIAQFEIWIARVIDEVSGSPEYRGAKVTEKSRLNRAILMNSEEYGRRKEVMATTEKIIDKLWVLQNGFEVMTKTLQSILAFRRVELESQLHGEAGES
jgi:hypothetical protein